jgi:hypothetical protein
MDGVSRSGPVVGIISQETRFNLDAPVLAQRPALFARHQGENDCAAARTDAKHYVASLLILSRHPRSSTLATEQLSLTRAAAK